MQEPDDDFLVDLASLMDEDTSLSKKDDLLKPVGKAIVEKDKNPGADKEKLGTTETTSKTNRKQLSPNLMKDDSKDLSKIEALQFDKQAPRSFEHEIMACTRNSRATCLFNIRCDGFIFGKKSQQGTRSQDDVGALQGSQNLKKRKWTDESMQPPNKRASYGQNVTTEKYTRLRLTNPLVSSAVMDQRMEGRKFLFLHQIRNKMVNGDISGDWVTGGVIVEKMTPRTSKKGGSFSTWKLSSLQVGFENNIISLFLFGECHTDHWKVQEGMCIALLNPNILPPKEDNSKNGSALTIGHSQQLMELGTSKDFGRCQGMVRKKETKCKNIVNRSCGDYCEYHIHAEYKKSRANRMEFQFGYGAPKHNPRKGNMMQKLKKSIDGGEFYYGGEVVTLGAPKEKPKMTLKSVMGHTLQAQAKKQLRESAAAFPEKNEANAGQVDESSEEFKRLLQFPTSGTRNMMKHLQKEDEEEEKAKKPVKFVSITPSELLRREKANMKKLREKANMAKLREKSQGGTKSKGTMSSAPLLARGCAPNEDIEFADCGDIISNSLGKRLDPVVFHPKPRLENTLTIKKARPDYSKEQAKSRAVQLWQERNVCDEKINSGVKKRSLEQAKEILRKVTENRSQDAETSLDNQGKATRKPGVLTSVFGSLDLNSEEGKKILEAKSSHSDLVKEDELKRSGLYFKALEKREMYENKLQSITELKVTAYCCKQCKYLAESASKLCEEEKHRVIKVEAKKRFFVCKKCKNRTYALNDRIPDHPCRNCGEMKYERTSMYKEKEGPKQEREKLLLRGEEHPKFLNSIK